MPMRPDPLTDKVSFFILGSGRMGSTFLFKVLSQHSQIGLTNEARIVDALHIAYNAVVTPYGTANELGFMGVVREDIRDSFVPIFLKHMFSALTEYYTREFGEEITHYGEKLPGVAAAYELGLLVPEPRFIVLIRDPRDVVCSFLALQRVEDPSVLGARSEEFLSQTIEDFASEWAATYDEILRLVPNHLLVRYSELMHQPQVTTRRVLRYLGLSMEEQVLSAMNSERSTDGHGTSRTFTSSMGRFREDLTEDESRRIMAICGETWRRIDPVGWDAGQAPSLPASDPR
ncbi:MAG TPA: sulfotransferase [Planctomycetota bacterium]|nr:sulfotransferase [Planctomycetota bacterium]